MTKRGKRLLLDKDCNENTIADEFNNQYKADEPNLEIREKPSLNFIYGFVDSNGHETIPFIYKNAKDFSEGLACVQSFESNEYGFINDRGETVIDFQFKWASSFREGMALVKKDGKIGFIDKSGNVVVPFIYDYAEDFHCNVAKVRMGDKSGFIDRFCNEVIPISYEDVLGDSQEGLYTCIFKKNGKYGAFNLQGENVIPFIYDDIVPLKQQTFYAVKNSGKWGVMDNIGQLFIKIEYDFIGKLSGYLIKVQLEGKWGYVDLSGNFKVDCVYESIGNISEQFVSVQINNKWGFIDLDGNQRIAFKYEGVGNFDNGLASIYRLNQLIGYIDTYGNEYWED